MVDPNIKKYPELVTAVNGIRDYSNAVIDGNFDRAEAISGSLENLATGLNKTKDGLLNELNNKLKSEGKKPFDLDKEAGEQIAKLNSELGKNGLELISTSKSGSPSLASGPSPSESSSGSLSAPSSNLQYPDRRAKDPDSSRCLHSH